MPQIFKVFEVKQLLTVVYYLLILKIYCFATIPATVLILFSLNRKIVAIKILLQLFIYIYISRSVYILPACSQVQERSDVVPTLLSLPYPSKSKQNVHQEVYCFDK